MAQKSSSSHSFQKLKLDTSAPHKSIPSSFASIPLRTQPDQNAHLQSQLTAELAGVEPQKILVGHNGLLSHISYGSAVSSGSDEDGFEIQPWERTPSISFSSEVRLDSGQRLGLGVPVPKHARPLRAHSLESESYSDQDILEIPFNARRSLQTQGNAPYPLLQSTVGNLNNDLRYNDQVASLTSEPTISPPLDEARTPLDHASDFILSPLSAPSPGDFSSHSPRHSNLRRASRRSSNRSGRSLSSMSPAASFLSRYKASEGSMKPSEPDDEGQGIGYGGEYIIGKQIGYGGFSVVKEVTSIENGKPIVNAVKIVRKNQRGKSELENEQIQAQFDQEVEIWRFLRHPYILPLLRVYMTDFATFCITKLVKGGTLFELVRSNRQRNRTGLPEHIAKRYAYQLASAMQYLHNDVQVVHRDIKLENVLLDLSGPDAEQEGGDVLLCDFGMTDFILSDQRDGLEIHSTGGNHNMSPSGGSTSVAGSLQYAAPELFDAPGPIFSPAADVWAYGVILFALLTSTLPFNDGLDVKTIEKIQNADWSEDLVRGSESVRDEELEDVLALLRGCLSLNVDKRWAVHDILESAWFSDCKQRYENVSRDWAADL